MSEKENANNIIKSIPFFNIKSSVTNSECELVEVKKSVIPTNTNFNSNNMMNKNNLILPIINFDTKSNLILKENFIEDNINLNISKSQNNNINNNPIIDDDDNRLKSIRLLNTISKYNLNAENTLITNNRTSTKVRKHSSTKKLTNKYVIESKLKTMLSKQKTFFQKEKDDADIKLGELNEEKTFRQVLDSCLSTNKRKQQIQSFICIISLLSNILYIVSTYYPNLLIYLNYFDYGVCFIFLIEYCINLSLAHHRLNFIFSAESIIDLTFLIPPILSLYSINLQSLQDFINVSRVLRILRFFRIFSIFKSGENDVNKQIWMIINTLIMLVLICSGVMQIVEHDEVSKRISISTDTLQKDNLLMRRSFHHYIYFIIVTISTVGYGDIVPYTILGKLIVMALVLFTIVLIPKQTNDLIQLMSAQSEYARRNYTASQEVPHIIITGDITIDSLKSFCQELFHPDHGTQYRHAVIIQASLPSREMEILLNEKMNENKIFYLEGDPMNEKDLLRADIGKARACIIFNNKNSQDSYSSDHQNLLLGLYIKKFVYNTNHENVLNNLNNGMIEENTNTNFRLCIQLIKPESKYHYFNALQGIYRKRMPPDQLILIEEIKMNLLSKSCITPGILAIVSNLVMSASVLPNGTDSEWLKEYAEGRGHEIYRIQLTEYYKSLNFLDLVKEIYSNHHAILFAIEFEVDKTTVIKLNPGTTLTIQYIILNLCGAGGGNNNLNNINNFDDNNYNTKDSYYPFADKNKNVNTNAKLNANANNLLNTAANNNNFGNPNTIGAVNNVKSNFNKTDLEFNLEQNKNASKTVNTNNLDVNNLNNMNINSNFNRNIINNDTIFPCPNDINNKFSSTNLLNFADGGNDTNNLVLPVSEKQLERVKVFAYLICSDKSEADNIANKDKFDEKKKSTMYGSIYNNIFNNMYENVNNTKNFNNLNNPNNESTKGKFNSNNDNESENSHKNNNPININLLNNANNNIYNPVNATLTVNNLNQTMTSSRKTRIQNKVEIDSDDLSQNSDENLNNIGEDFEISSDDYFLNTAQNNDYTIDIMQHTIKDSQHIQNHVIVCGIHPAIIHFLLPLRAKYLEEGNLKYIVILAPHLPQNMYDSFTKFPKIIFIQGSPLLPENLYRANIMNADKVVILSSMEGKINTQMDDEIQMLDAETIFIYKAIKKCNKNIQIMTELITTSNVEYLLHKNYLNNGLYERSLYEFTPLFAAGEVFTPSIIDRITCLSYFSPHILTILELLLNGGTRGKNRKIKKLEDDLNLIGSNLWLIRTPEALVDETFEELFTHLIKSHKVVAIALYRKNISEDLYYVYTNPKNTTLIQEMDLVFVLGQYSNIVDLLDFKDEENLNTKFNCFDDENCDFDFKNFNNLKNKTFVNSSRQENINNLGINNINDKKENINLSTGTSLGNNNTSKIENVNNYNISNTPANNNYESDENFKNENNSNFNKTKNNLIKQKSIKFSDKDTLKRRQSIAQFRGKFNSVTAKEKMKLNSVEEPKKENNSSKYIEIEKIKKRISKIQDDIEKLKDNYVNLPKELEEFIDKEIENELNIYLNNNYGADQ